MADVPAALWFPTVSADGHKWVVGGLADDFGMLLYTSTNAGATWVEGRLPLNITTILCFSRRQQNRSGGPGHEHLHPPEHAKSTLQISGVSMQ